MLWKNWYLVFICVFVEFNVNKLLTWCKPWLTKNQRPLDDLKNTLS